jgi:hypothetical protein
MTAIKDDWAKDVADVIYKKSTEQFSIDIRPLSVTLPPKRTGTVYAFTDLGRVCFFRRS